LQGKPLSISCERFAQILGFGEEDLGHPKIHGGEIPLDSEMAFMYDSIYGKVEFGTTHGMKPIYRMLNQLFRYALTPKIGDNYNISNIAKDILVRMAQGEEKFSVFDFIWEEIIVCSVSANKSYQYAPWIFKMICEMTGVDILTDKTHTWYKLNKGNIEHLLKLGKHAPTRATSSGGPSSGGPSCYEPPSPLVDRQLPEALFPPTRRRASLTFYLRASSLASMLGSTMHRRSVLTGSTLKRNSSSWRLLTPKTGTGKRLTCEPNLAEGHHSARGFPQSIR
jgi:hypothetical protein